MGIVARREGLVLVLVGIVFLSFLYPSLRYARRETRDGIRRDEVAAFKQVLEQYYNKHETYPLQFDASPHEYVVTKQTNIGAAEWFLRARLENSAEPTAEFDAEADRNYYYRIKHEGGVTYYEVCGGAPDCPLE